MTIDREARRRAIHLVRIVRAGVPTLWAVIGVVTIFVGGSIFLGFVWGVRHIAWGLVFALATISVMLVEGSYRESCKATRESHSTPIRPLRELVAEGQAIRARLPERNRRGLVSLPADLVRDFDTWKSKVASALKPWPQCQKQFLGQIHYGMSLLEPDRKSSEIEQRTKVLDQILESLERQHLGSRDRSAVNP